MIYLGEKVHDENDDTAFIISILPNDQPPLTSPPSSPNLTTSTEVIQDTAKVLFMTKQVRSRSTQFFSIFGQFFRSIWRRIRFVLNNSRHLMLFISFLGSCKDDSTKLLQRKRNVVLYSAKTSHCQRERRTRWLAHIEGTHHIRHYQIRKSIAY